MWEIIIVKYSLFQVLKGILQFFSTFLFLMRTKEMRVSVVTFIQMERCYNQFQEENILSLNYVQ